MTRFAVAALCLCGTLAAAPAPTESKTPADWPAALKDREFKMPEAGAEACAVAARKAGAEVTVSGSGERGGSVDFKVTIKDGKPVEVIGHSSSAFVVRDGMLFFADFHSASNGCKVTAFDLKTGKQAWSQKLLGVGVVAHFGYRNRVGIAVEKHPTADALGVVISGWETKGRYVEVLDPATGKMLANRQYDVK